MSKIPAAHGVEPVISPVIPDVRRFSLYLLGATFLILLGLPVSAGERTERALSLHSFDRVYVNGPLRVHLLQHTELPTHSHTDESRGAYVSGSAAGLDQLQIEQADGTLYLDLSTGPAVDSDTRMTVFLPVEELKEIVSQGGAQIFAEQLATPSLALEGQDAGQFIIERVLIDDLVIVGSGNTIFVLSGVVQNQLIELAGLGSFHGAALQSDTSHINIQGAGKVDVWARELLQVSVLGAARVRYDGSPWIYQQIQGSGAVTRIF
ncbi:MAG: GIN domain-containing protein [bacterium]